MPSNCSNIRQAQYPSIEHFSVLFGTLAEVLKVYVCTGARKSDMGL